MNNIKDNVHILKVALAQIAPVWLDKEKTLDKVKKDFDDKKPRISRKKRMENRAKGSIRILRSQGYSMAEALMITKGQMGLDRKLVPLVDDSEE